MRRGPVLAIAIAVLMACDKKGSDQIQVFPREQAAETSPRPVKKPYPSPSWKEIRDDSVRSEPALGFIARTRTFRGKIAPGDPLALAIHFDPIDKSRTRTPGFVFNESQIHIEGPEGETVVLSTRDHQWVRHVFEISTLGLKINDEVIPWKNPAPDLFQRPGTYTVHVAFALQDGTPGPVSGRHRIEVVEKKFLPQSKLIQLAQKYVTGFEGTDALMAPWLLPVDDEVGNIVFRFTVESDPLDWSVAVTHMALTPLGEPLGGYRTGYSACVAHGSIVRTPTGTVPVQELVPGDALLSFDPDTGAEVITHVRAVRASVAPRLFRVGELLTTGEHPVFRNGTWSRAAELGTSVVGRSWVFDVEVDPPHTFYAGGEIVHNKAIGSPIGGRDDPWDGLFHRPPKQM